MYNDESSESLVEPTPLNVLLDYITAVGIYSMFIERFDQSLQGVLGSCIKRLTNLTLREIRETSTDHLERAVGAVEDISIAMLGVSDKAGRLYEKVTLLAMTKQYLSCPYLNRYGCCCMLLFFL